MDEEYEKYALKDSNELVSLVVDLITQGAKINDAMHEKVKMTNIKKDIFLSNFPTKMVEIAASIITLVSKEKVADIGTEVFKSKEQLNDAAILTRSVLEGMWGFQAYKKDNSLAERWYSYTIYDAYRRQLRIEKVELNNDTKAAEAAAHRWLNNTYDLQDIIKAHIEFDCFNNPKQNWYNHEGILELTNSFCDKQISLIKRYNILDSKKRSELLKGCRKFYAKAYGDFSRIVHWSPLGIGGTDPVQIDDRFMLAVTFQSLYTMLKYVNDEYHLGFDNELNDLLNLYSK